MGGVPAPGVRHGSHLVAGARGPTHGRICGYIPLPRKEGSMKYLDYLSPAFIAVATVFLLFALVMGTLWCALQ